VTVDRLVTSGCDGSTTLDVGARGASARDNPNSLRFCEVTLATSGQLKALDLQVREAVRGGAHLSMGGRRKGGRGAFYEPTVLDRVKRGMKVMSEEVFGPVAPIYVAKDEEEAIEVANDSEFGLGSSLWTSSGDKARNLASRIESGIVFINDLVKSDPRMPFGGIKNSGIGRELSKYGLKEFVNVKSVNIFGIEGVAASPPL